MLANMKPQPWAIIVIAFFIFWPAGLLLLFHRMTNDKSTILKDHKFVGKISYAMMFFGSMFLYSSFIRQSTYYAFVAISLIGGGIWLLSVAKKMKVDGKRFKKYIALVVNQNVTSIDYIASSLLVSYQDVVKDLQKMISAGYFTGAVIDEEKREIILNQSAPSGEVKGQSKVAVCDSCGANNTVITGQVKECEYCGSPIK